ncbi:spermine synthase-like [Tigriopus californicus]|uniref:spermine synthase-like n=1 Tax=Tigriopus californicus TaxID=6832 RepID=UPI0027DA4A18|nr:spermine synthase-like [Tigriopus californicus]
MSEKGILEFKALRSVESCLFHRCCLTLERHFGLNFEKIQKIKGSKVETVFYQSEDLNSTLMFKYHIASKAITIEIDSPTFLKTMSFEDMQDLAKLIQMEHEQDLGFPNQSDSWQQLPILQLGQSFNQYLTTSDGRVIQYGFKSRVFHDQSKYQTIDIYDTEDHGKILLLDGVVNLAENDTKAYTEILLGLPKNEEQFNQKRVLILGGGDGGLLKSLLTLTHPPSQIDMVEIDEKVMTACSTHIPSICEPYLSQRSGPNFNVITGDCFRYLEVAQGSGTKFDAIICDLTDIPLTENGTTHPHFELSQRALQESRTLLDQGGKYLTHCNGINVPSSVGNFKTMLKSIVKDRAQIIMRSSFVPSFHEVWTFFELEMK